MADGHGSMPGVPAYRPQVAIARDHRGPSGISTGRIGLYDLIVPGIESNSVANALLRHNYIPSISRDGAELPPCFTTRSFAPEVAKHLASSMAVRKGGYDVVTLHVSRFDAGTRRLEIPHPLPFARLVLAIESNWSRLVGHLESEASAIKPAMHPDGRIFAMNMPNAEGEYAGPSDDELNRSRALGARYRVKADIARFYSSLYSHSLPWALVGHATAKREQGDSRWYNKLDIRLRHCKRNETAGVSIGPGTSAILAEVVLNAIDKRMARFSYTRYIDDFLFYAETREQAEEFLSTLRDALADFSLELNPLKTRIDAEPNAITPSWVRHLRRLSRGISTPEAVLDLLDESLDTARTEPSASSVKWGMAVAESVMNSLESSPNLPQVPMAMGAIAWHHPVVVANLVRAGVESPGPIDVSPWYGMLREHSIYRRVDAVCWLLYGLLAYGEEISERTASELIGLDDNFVSALLLQFDVPLAHAKIRERFLKLPAGSFDRDRYWILGLELLWGAHISDAELSDDALSTLKVKGTRLVSMGGLSRQDRGLWVRESDAADLSF
jgi:hypothetical protein